MRNVSKKYLRKIILSRRCSSTGRCAPFGVASTFQNHREWLMITKNKNYQQILRFLSGGRKKNQKRLNCADRRYLMLCEREELLFKVGANTILPPNKEIFGPRKALQNGPTYQNTVFFDKMVKWVAYDTIGAPLPVRMTNFFNTKWEHNRKNKRKI